MVKIEELLEAGVHFGHRITKWNPRMAPFIFGERNGIHIIDLIQTAQYLNETTNFLKNFKKPLANESPAPASNRRKEILFVGTKKQASSLIEFAANKINGMSEALSSIALSGSNVDFSEKATGAGAVFAQAQFVPSREANQPTQSNRTITAHYVNHRWLGGLLTNWATMKICIDHLNTLETREAKGELNTLPKKERAVLKKQYDKLNTYFGGIKTMKDRPNIVIIIGQDSEMNAVRECNKLQSMAELADGKSSTLRTITLLDTNCDPSLADLFIPANDDSTKSLELILGKLTEALCS